jgi:hypothetical protein
MNRPLNGTKAVRHPNHNGKFANANRCAIEQKRMRLSNRSHEGSPDIFGPKSKLP